MTSPAGWRSSTGIPAPPSAGRASIDPLAPTTLYAGTTSGVLKTPDGGATWNVTGLTNTSVFELRIDPITPTTLYARVFAPNSPSRIVKSTDGGANWSDVSPPVTQVTALAIDSQTPATLYAGTLHGVFKSTDAGRT